MVAIGFLHTAPVHVAGFDELVAAADPTSSAVHVVDESLLATARREGLDDDRVRDGIATAISSLGACDVVVCTCSTIGGLAESIGRRLRRRVVRVDRPMAEAAVRLAASGAGRIVVAATLESTLAPTGELLAQIIESRDAEVDVEVGVVAGAWERFEAGDHEGYLTVIRGALPALAEGADVVVLAQASMAGAADAAPVEVPVLSSPRAAVASLLGC